MARDTERTGRIRAALAGERLDGVVCALPGNVLLLSGYWPVVGSSIAVAARDGPFLLLVPADERELAEAGGADEVRTFEPGSLEDLRTAATAVAHPLRHAVRDLGLDHGAIGCEFGAWSQPASYVAMNLYGAVIRETLGCAVSADELLARLRTVKTPIELDRIRRACRIAGVAYHEGAARLMPGLTEAEAAAAFAAPLGSIGTGYQGTERAGGFAACMSGANAGRAYGAMARSRAKTISGGDLVLAHYNSHADGYWTDITRTFSMGPPGDRAARMYEAVFAARAAALDAIRPGAHAAEVDRAARSVLRERGFELRFKHSTGHGVGFAAIDHDARPRLHPASPDVLETGMVFNVEPGIYFDGWGGMRHCDMAAVTERGCELLTPFLCGVEELIR